MSTVLKFVIIVVLFFTLVHCDYEYYLQGQRLYEAHCENCHMEDGSGLELLIPNIGESKYFNSEPIDLYCLIQKGIPSERDDGLEMPAFKNLNNVEMCNLINYLNKKWAEDFQAIQINDTDAYSCD